MLFFLFVSVNSILFDCGRSLFDNEEDQRIQRCLDEFQTRRSKYDDGCNLSSVKRIKFCPGSGSSLTHLSYRFFLNFEIFSQDSLDRYVLFGYLSRRRDGIILFGDFLVHHFDLETDHVGFHWNNLFHSTSNNISFLFVRFFSLDRW